VVSDALTKLHAMGNSRYVEGCNQFPGTCFDVLQFYRFPVVKWGGSRYFDDSPPSYN